MQPRELCSPVGNQTSNSAVDETISTSSDVIIIASEFSVGRSDHSSQDLPKLIRVRERRIEGIKSGVK